MYYPLFEVSCVLSLRPSQRHARPRIVRAAYSEVGDRCLLALVIDNGNLLLRYSARERTSPVLHQLPWPSSVDRDRISALCFDPSGTWLLCAARDAALYVVPALALMDATVKVDHQWPLDDVTKIEMSGKRGVLPPTPLPQGDTGSSDCAPPTSATWWQTTDNQQIAIIGNELGEICFINLVTKKEVGGTYITVAITALQLIRDDVQDNIYLLVTGSNGVQWQLLLEQPSSNYRWPLEQDLEPPMSGKQNKEMQRMPTDTGHIDHQPQRLANFAGHTHLTPQNVKGRHLVSGYYAPTSILSIHSGDLNVVPLFVYKLPAACERIVMTDRIIFVTSMMKRQLHVLSSQLAESSIDGKKDFHSEAELQNFPLPNDEAVILLTKQTHQRNNNGSTAVSRQTAALARKQGTQSVPCSPRGGTSRLRWSSGGTANPNRQSSTDNDPLSGQPLTNLDGCLVVCETAVYECRSRLSPEQLFLQLVLGQQELRASERLSIALGLDLNRLYEAAADCKLGQGQFAAAVRLYQLSKCPHVRSVANFAAHGCVAELLSYVRVLSLGHGGHVEFAPADKRQFASIQLLCYIHQILDVKSGTAALVQAFRHFLNENIHYSESLAVQLLAEQGMFDLLSWVALKRGLLLPMVQELLQQTQAGLELSTVAAFRDRGFGALLRGKDNEHYLHCLTEPRLLVYLLTQPTLAQRHSHALLPMLTSMPASYLIRSAHLYNPSRYEVRPFLHHSSLDVNRDCDQCLKLGCDIWQINLQEPETSQIHYIVQTFIAVLLVLNANRGFTPFNSSFLQLLYEDTGMSVSIGSMQRGRLPRRSSPIGCGLAHAALVRNGDVYTWGKTNKCSLGQGLPHQDYISPTPLQFFPQLRMRVVAVSCGAYHCVALTNHGVFGWGSSVYGQVGTGQVDKEPYPVPLATLVGERIVSVVCGQYHSIALTDDGRVFTWGWGVHGQLGHGKPEDCHFPHQISALDGEMVVRVSAGYGHSAVLTAKGDVYTFGCGLFGQLGTGTVEKSCLPKHVQLPEKINLLACGYFHNIAVSASNKIYTWGSNPQLLRSQAQASRKARLQAHLGRGNNDPEPEREPAVDGEQTSAESGKEPTLNIEKKGPQSHLLPSLMESTLTSPITQVACGSHHSALLTVDGEVFTWGRNLDGQLGNGTRKEQKIPTPIIALEECKITHIACGLDFTLAMDGDGRLWGWGHNDCGQIGLDMEPVPACNKTIMIKTNKRVVQLRNTAQWGVVRPQEVKGLAAPRVSFEYQPMPSFEDDNEHTKENNDTKELPFKRINLPSLLNLEDPPFGCKTIHIIVEAMFGHFNCEQVIAWALQCKNFQLAAKVSLLQKNIPQSAAYQFQALHKMSIGASKMPDILKVLEFYFKIIDESDMEKMKQLLQHVLELWMSERLPVTPLEEFFQEKISTLAHPLNVLLLCYDDLQTSPTRDITNYVVSRFSTNFCLALMSAAVEQMKAGTEYPEFLALLDSMNWNGSMPGSWSEWTGGDAIAVSSTELESLLMEQETSFADSPSSPEIVVFTCGHHFPRRLFDACVLPRFEEAMRTQLPQALPRTTHALLASYRADRLMPMACPDCVLDGIRDEL